MVARCSGLLVGVALVAIAGCGGAAANVSGTITVGGETYENLRVSFIPVAGGATATCTTDAQGNYTVRTGQGLGLEPGEYRVTIKGYSKSPSPMMTKAEVDALRIVPPEHSRRDQTPHRAKVAPGRNRFDFAI